MLKSGNSDENKNAISDYPEIAFLNQKLKVAERTGVEPAWAYAR